MQDYCFAIEHYPKTRYENLQDFLVLPSKSRIKAIVSSVDVNDILKKMFSGLKISQQRYCFLVVDEVKIRPTISYSESILHGMAENTEKEGDEKSHRATSMLGILAKCLHGGPSVMISITPVHQMSATFQFQKVKEVAATVEECGGYVLGSITDNHKVNQRYCTLFTRKTDCEAVHPLDEDRPWFLLYDTVHLLKCIRNNWISEKSQIISFDNSTFGSFSDVRSLYDAEKDSILKTTPLTAVSVNPSKLQLQSVGNALKVFNDKVVAALSVQNKVDTAHFVRQVVEWWKLVNVSSKGKSARFSDQFQSVQTNVSSTYLQHFIDLFTNASSGQGCKRIHSLTHDTRRALVQTMCGFKALCTFLYGLGFKYVLLGAIQSDRIEGEFGVYRQSTGGNNFMIASDVLVAFKKRLTKFSANFLNHVEVKSQRSSYHNCSKADFDVAYAIENANQAPLTVMEEYSSAYVAGWLEKKCEDLVFGDEEPLVPDKAKVFIEEVSRGGLVVPHMCTYEFVRSGLSFVKTLRYEVCCQKRLMQFLGEINNFFDFGSFESTSFLRRLANVLLRGLHNIEKDTQRNAVLYQTSIKKYVYHEQPICLCPLDFLCDV